MSIQVEELKTSGFTGQIVFPNDDQWTASTQAWGAQSKRSPKVALRPLSATDVSKAILWLNDFQLDFAVRSGGMAESQSDDVIIDLSLLNKTEYDAEHNTFRLGPGQAWRDVYTKLADLKVTVLGGRVGFVGVGGFTLCGGLSYLSNLHGLASNSLVDAEVVLADGSIIRAADDKDLLFALKGAGHAFGVVTELVVRAYPKPDTLYAGFLIYTLDKYSAISTHISTLAASNTNPKVNAMAALVRMPPNMDHVVLVMPMVIGSAEYARAALAWAWEVGPIQDMTREMSSEEAAALQDMFVHRPSPTTTYQQNSLVVSKLTPDIMDAALKWQTELQNNNPRFYGAAVLFEPFFPGAFACKDIETAAWPPHAQTTPTWHVVEVFIEQPDAQPGHAAENAAHLRACVAAMEAVAEPGTVLAQYPNYALAGTPAVAFYGKNLGRLKEVKGRVDPGGRFDKGIKIV